MFQQQVPHRVKRPLFVGGLTAVVVTAAALGCAPWLALLLSVVLVVWFCCRRMVLCAVLAMGFFLLAMGWRCLYADPTAHLNGETDTLTGVVVDQPTYGDMYTVQVTASSVLRPHTRVMLLCDGEDTPTLDDTVTACVRLYAVKDNQTYYASRGAFVCAFAAENANTDIVVTGHSDSPVAAVRWRLRRALVSVPRRFLGERESGILTALCFGESAFVPTATTAAFQGSGVSHLLVVSGLHVSMVAAAILLALRRLGRRLCHLLTIITVWSFAWLVGLSPSVFRAAMMCTVWLVGNLLFCRADGLNSLGLAAILLLAVNPYTLWNVGFQLSFAATLGVLVLAGRLMPPYDTRYDPDSPWWHTAWRRWRHTLVNGAAVCVSALLFTLPIAAYHYGGLPLTAVVANVLAVPAAGAALLLGWLGTLCGLVPFLGWLSKGILLIADLLTRYMAWVAEVCSPDWAWLTVSQRWQWLLLGGLCLLAVCAVVYRIPRRRLAASLTALAVLTVGVGLPLTVSPVSVTAVSSDNEGGLILRQGAHCALLLTHVRELDEVVYATTPFTPEVIFVGEGTAVDRIKTDRFPTAMVIAAASAYMDDPAVAVCSEGGTVTLWRGCRLTMVSETWWRLQIGTDVLWVCTDPTAEAPDTDGMRLYVGGTPTYPPPEAYAVVCSQAWLRRRHPTLTGREIFVIEEPITFIPHRGEWSVSLWL